MFFGMDAGDAPGDRAGRASVPAASPEKHQRLGIDEQQADRGGEVRFFPCCRIFLQDEMFKLPDGKTPEPVGVNELDEVRAAAESSSTRAGKLRLGWQWM